MTIETDISLPQSVKLLELVKRSGLTRSDFQRLLESGALTMILDPAATIDPGALRDLLKIQILQSPKCCYFGSIENQSTEGAVESLRSLGLETDFSFGDLMTQFVRPAMGNPLEDRLNVNAHSIRLSATYAEIARNYAQSRHSFIGSFGFYITEVFQRLVQMLHRETFLRDVVEMERPIYIPLFGADEASPGNMFRLARNTTKGGYILELLNDPVGEVPTGSTMLLVGYRGRSA